MLRDTQEEDTFSWPCSKSSQYSASATYKRLCVGRVEFGASEWIWKSKAPLKCKIFAWLAIQYRLWTSDRRARHNLQAQTSPCFVCLQEEDTVDHLLLHCVYAREVWFRCAQELGVSLPTPSGLDRLEPWWHASRMSFRMEDRKKHDTLFILVCWSLWKHRNAWAFNNRNGQYTPEQLVRRVRDEWQTWEQVAAGGRYHPP